MPPTEPPAWARVPASRTRQSNAPPPNMTSEEYFRRVQEVYPNAVMTGGGRTPERNREVGGAANSMHLDDNALDFAVPGVPFSQVRRTLRRQGLPITEGLDEGNHFHLGWRQPGGGGGGGQRPPAWALTGVAPAAGARPTVSHPSPAGAPAWARGPAPAGPARRPAATGFGMIGETVGDLLSNNRPDHDPNSIEQFLINEGTGGEMARRRAHFVNAVTNTPYVMEPVRMAMEGMGVGRRPGETDSQFHTRYSAALQGTRQDAAAEIERTDATLPPGSRPGQMALNFATDVVAHPEFLLAPASIGTSQTIVGGMARAGAANALIGGGADAAGQLLEMSQGDRDEYDANQTLQNTALGGVFGAGLHGGIAGLSRATPFVRDLFARRGSDTTPSADPTTRIQGQNAPATPEDMAQNAAHHAEYEQLLRTGSLDDINHFFDQRGGPRPNPEEVAQYVNRRDNTTRFDPENPGNVFEDQAAYNGLEDHVAGRNEPGGRRPDFNYEQEYNNAGRVRDRDTHRSTVQDYAAERTSGWANAPEVEVVHSPHDIADQAIRDAVLASPDYHNAVGLFGADGKVRLFSQNIHSNAQADAVLFHEGLAHFGLARVFQKDLDMTMMTLYDRNVGALRREVDRYRKKNPTHSLALAVEETLAKASERGPLKPSWLQGVLAPIKRAARRAGIDVKYSDAEVRHILGQAHDAVINGEKSAADNMFRNRFMIVGKQARGHFDEFFGDNESGRRFTGRDDQPRAEISDANSTVEDPEWINQRTMRDSVTGEPLGEGVPLSEVLNHDTLYETYPQLRDVPVVFRENLRQDKNWSGFAVGSRPHADHPHGAYIVVDSKLSGGRGLPELHDTIIHEVQHIIQDFEHLGNVRGGTAHLEGDEYWFHPAEIEARSAENRRRMPQEMLDRNGPNPNLVREPSGPLVRPSSLTNGEIQYNLSAVDRLKLDPRYTKDPEFRANVAELARVQNTIEEKGPLWPSNPEVNSYDGHNSFTSNPAAKRRWENMELSEDTTRRLAEGWNPDNPKFMTRTTEEGEFAAASNDARDVKAYDYAAGRIANGDILGALKLLPETDRITALDHLNVEVMYFAKDHGISDSREINRLLDLSDNLADALEGKSGVGSPELVSRQLQQALTRISREFPSVTQQIADGWRASSLPSSEYIPYGTKIQDGSADYSEPPNPANRFMHIDEDRPGYEHVPEDLEAIAKHIDENYHPEPIPLEQTQERALNLGISPSRIRRLRERDPGQLAARVARMGEAADRASQHVRSLLDKLDTPEWTMDHQVELASAIADRNYLVERFKGEATEMGRALRTVRSFRSYTNNNLSEVLRVLREDGDNGLAAIADPSNPEGLKFMRLLKQLLAGNNPRGANAMMGGINRPYWWQYLTSFRMNMMLSGLSTPAKAAIDTATGISRNVVEKTLALPVGQLRQLAVRLTGRTPTRGVSVDELRGHLNGLLRAVAEGEVYRQSLRALRTGEGSYVIPGTPGIVKGAPTVTPVNFNGKFGIPPARVGDLGPIPTSLLNKPGDLLSAIDTFFRSVEINGQLEGLAYREAQQQLGPGASRAQLRALAEHLATNPTRAMLAEAEDTAARVLLMNNNPLNGVIDKLRAVRPGMSAGEQMIAFLASNFFPFIRAQTNSVVERIIRRSPLAFLDKATRQDIARGGAHADIAWARIAYGTALWTLYWNAGSAANNLLTGQGPTNPSRRAELLAAGRRPNSLREPDGNYSTGNNLASSVNPFDLHNQTASLVASARQTYDEALTPGHQVNAVRMALTTVMAGLADMSWVSDLDPILSSFTERGDTALRAQDRFAGNIAGSFVPNLVGQQARMNDVQRDTGGPDQIANAVRNNIPGLRQELPVRYDVYGNPMQTGASLTGVHTPIPGLPGNRVIAPTDPTEVELVRLGDSMERLRQDPANSDLPHTLVTPVQRYVTIEGERRDLTPREFQEYQRRAGRYIVADAREMMQSPEWQTMSDRERVDAIRTIVRDQKANARDELFTNE